MNKMQWRMQKSKNGYLKFAVFTQKRLSFTRKKYFHAKEVSGTRRPLQKSDTAIEIQSADERSQGAPMERRMFVQFVV